MKEKSEASAAAYDGVVQMQVEGAAAAGPLSAARV